VEQVHSSIMERKMQAKEKTGDATEVFEKAAPSPEGGAPPEVLTIDFLKKYLRYCKRFAPVLTEEAQVEVANRYVDLRMRWQSGQAHPDAQRKPRLAVTTRTLEAIIRLATAHAKLKLQKHHVREEDVKAAYELMLAAREEEDPKPEEPVADAAAADDEAPDAPAPGGRKRKRAAAGQEASAAGAASSQEEGVIIQSGRKKVLSTLVARVFVRHGKQEMQRGDLLESVNAALAQGEDNFTEEEFGAGMDHLERQNKVMMTEDGLVYFVG